MLKEIYFVNENGQVEMNFDALELKTSKPFVDRIQHFLSMVKPAKIVNVIDSTDVDNTYIRVYVKDRLVLHIYEYFRTGIDETITRSFYSVHELEMMKGLLEDHVDAN